MKRSNALTFFLLILFCLSCKKDNSNQNNEIEKLGLGCDPTPQDSLLLIPELDTTDFFTGRLMNLPSVYSLDMPPIENQGGEFSCVGFACAYAARSYQHHRDNDITGFNNDNNFSPEFLYNSIKKAGNCKLGTTYLSALKFLKNQGVCTWAKMPYSSANGCSELPNQTQKDNASLFKIDDFFRIRITTDNYLKRILVENNPILIAVELDEGFQTNNNVTWKKQQGKKTGGHAMVICGWDDNKDGGAWKVMNSYGSDWHDNGYGWIAYDYLDNVVMGVPLFKEMYVMKTSPVILPVADFRSSQTNITVGNSINFTDLSTGSPTSWSWNFQGGTPATSNLQNPTNIKYTSIGTYTVTLIASNATGNNTKTKTGYIIVDETNPQLPTLTTTTITNLANISAISGGNITNQGTSAVTSRGVCWSSSQNPTIANSKTMDGSGTGSFTSSITGLVANTQYYVRAYATNSNGTAYGNELNFKTTGTLSNCGGNSTLTDPRDGKTYKIVQIGTQCWLAENLNYATDSSWCYDNNSSNCTTYGRLYNWEAALTACPSGWHLPSDTEWTTLTDYLGGEDVAGGKMKSIAGWIPPNTGATNESGFSGLPGGIMTSINYFRLDGEYGYFWSSTEQSTFYANQYRLRFSSGDYIDARWPKESGMSCRCVKD